MCLLARFVLKIRFAALHPRDSSDLFLHLGGLALAFPRSPDNIVILTILFLKQPTSSAYPNCILTGCPSNDSAWEFFGTSCWIVVLKLPPGCEKSFALPWEPRLVFFLGFTCRHYDQVERVNQKLEASLWCTVSMNPSTWSSQIAWEEYAHNSLTSSATRRSATLVSLCGRWVFCTVCATQFLHMSAALEGDTGSSASDKWAE